MGFLRAVRIGLEQCRPVKGPERFSSTRSLATTIRADENKFKSRLDSRDRVSKIGKFGAGPGTETEENQFDSEGSGARESVKFNPTELFE